MTHDPVVIIGAGLAGLTAANYLRQHDREVLVLEASKNVAGLARSERDPDGFTYDYGAHFITNRLAAAVGCSATCREMPAYGETVWLHGRCYSYPFGLMRHLRFLASAGAAKIRGLVASPATSALEWSRRAYGSALADEVAVPLMEAWSGVPASELSASVGEKFTTRLPRTLGLKLMARATRRTVTIGYSSTVPESPHVWHVYPEGGIGAVCEHLATTVQDAIRVESPASAIVVQNNRVVGVRSKDTLHTASAVVSTVPVHLLAKLVQGTDRLQLLARFRYRPMVFVNLRFDGPSGLPDVVTWTPEQRFPFFRLSDIGQGLPWLVPAGCSQVTADIGCAVGDATWTSRDEALGQQCVAGLEAIVPGLSKRYRGCRVMRTPLAYPVYHRDYETDRLRFQSGTGVDGLHSIGRNGEFSHLLMEDVFWRTRRKIRELVAVR